MTKYSSPSVNGDTRARSVCEKIIDIENVMHESMDYLGSYPNYERPKMNGARMPTMMSTVRGVGCGKNGRIKED